MITSFDPDNLDDKGAMLKILLIGSGVLIWTALLTGFIANTMDLQEETERAWERSAALLAIIGSGSRAIEDIISSDYIDSLPAIGLTVAAFWYWRNKGGSRGLKGRLKRLGEKTKARLAKILKNLKGTRPPKAHQPKGTKRPAGSKPPKGARPPRPDWKPRPLPGPSTVMTAMGRLTC
jgi:hypothetical protein